MKYSLCCKDAGSDCGWCGEAKTKEELLTKVTDHVKTVHHYTDAQIKDPKMVESVKAAIRMK